MMSRFRLLGCAALAAGGLLASAACGGNSSTVAAAGSTGGTRVLQPSDRAGGTLEALNDSDCDYWDPQRTYGCWNAQRWISRQLVTYAPRPGPATLSGDLAEAVPSSPDLRVWTYRLRAGIKFEDGTPITSRDIKYGIERTFATDVINGGPTYVNDYLDNPKAPYPGPYRDPAPDKLGLSSIETPDDRTIVFHLNRPFADWNYIMASPVSTPVPRAKDTGSRYTFHPVSSGPYKIQNYVPNKSMVLVRNPAWNRATDPNRKALPDKIVITMGLAPEDIDQRILADQGDIYLGGFGVQVAAQARILADPHIRQTRTTDDYNGATGYLTLFTKVAPFDNVHCRRAVAWAVDKRAQLIARGGPSGGEIATTMLPPSIAPYEKFNPFPSAEGTGDVAKAKQELAACGHPQGFSTTVVSRTLGKDVAQAVALQSSLARIGIKVSIEKFDPAGYYSAAIGVPANVHERKYGLAIAAQAGDWPAPYAFFSPLVDGRKILAQGNSNFAELNDPEVNTGLQAGATELAGDDQQRIWASVDEAVVKSAAYIPLLYARSFSVYSSRLTNVYLSPAFSMADFSSLGVRPTA